MRRLILRAASQLWRRSLEERVYKLQFASSAGGGSSGYLRDLQTSVKHSFETCPLQKCHVLRVLTGSQLKPLSNTVLLSQSHSNETSFSGTRFPAIGLKDHNQQTNGGASSVFPRTQTRHAEPDTAPGLPTNPSYLSGRPLSQAVHEHFHSSGPGPLPCSLSNSVPRPPAQSAAKSSCQSELNLREHGPPFCDVTVPPFGLNLDAGNPDLLAATPLISAIPDRKPWQKSVLGGSVGAFTSARALCFWTGTASKQGVQVVGVRGFRSMPSGSILLAEESEDSEVTVTDQEEGVVPEKKKYGPRRSQRLPRSIIGSYGDDFEDELDLAEPSPWQGIMYDIRPKVDQFMIDEMGANPPLDLEDLVDEAEELGMISEIPDEYAGLPLVLRWETRFVLAPGPTAHHPLNRKVKLQAYLRDLGLSANARKRMIALVGPRFHPGKDELTLVSQRYPQREENRKDVLRILYALIDESKKADTEEEEMAAAA